MLTIAANQLDTDKAVEVLLYVVKRVPDMYKALKVVYFADKLHLDRYGCLMYGDTYIAFSHGPAPSAGYDMLKADPPNFLCEAAISARANFEHVGVNNRKALRDPDMDLLSESDVQCLDEAIQRYRYKGFKSVRDESHDGAFLATKRDDRMSLESIAKTLPNGKAALGKLGGLKGGKARAARLTPEQRSEIARNAALARWGRK